MPSNVSMVSEANEGSAGVSQKNKTKGRWTAEEHKCFLDSLRAFGKDWYRVEEAIGTRNSAQIRSHAQKFLSKLEKEPDHQEDYSDIKEILDVNLRLLKKSEKEPNGFGGRIKHSGGGRGRDAFPSGADGETPLELMTEQERAYQLYKQEYTLLPTALIFKVEKKSEIERNELIQKWKLERILSQRQEKAE